MGRRKAKARSREKAGVERKAKNSRIRSADLARGHSRQSKISKASQRERHSHRSKILKTSPRRRHSRSLLSSLIKIGRLENPAEDKSASAKSGKHATRRSRGHGRRSSHSHSHSPTHSLELPSDQMAQNRKHNEIGDGGDEKQRKNSRIRSALGALKSGHGIPKSGQGLKNGNKGQSRKGGAGCTPGAVSAVGYTPGRVSSIGYTAGIASTAGYTPELASSAEHIPGDVKGVRFTPAAVSVTVETPGAATAAPHTPEEVSAKGPLMEERPKKKKRKSVKKSTLIKKQSLIKKRKENTYEDPIYPYDNDTDSSELEAQESSSNESWISEEIDVFISDEFRDYVEMVTVGKLSRAGLSDSIYWSKLAFYCVTISYATSLDTIAMFDYVVARLGINFMILFVLCMYAIACPLLYLEFALGQYTHSSVLNIYNRIAPISVGLGVSALAAVFASIVIGNDFLEVMVSMFYGSFDVFINELPYDNCAMGNARPYCQSLHKRCHMIKNILLKQTNADDLNPSRLVYSVLGDTCIHSAIRSWDESFKENAMTYTNFVNKLPMIHYSHSNFDDFNDFKQSAFPSSTSLFITMGTFYLMAFMLVYRRHFLTVLAYIYMFLIFLVSFSIIIIYIYISPPSYPISIIFEKELKIANTETWLTAIIMACLCLRLGYGGMIFLGSQNKFHNDLLTDAMIVTIIVSLIYVSQAMLHVLVRDSFMMEALHGDYQAFSETLKYANDFSIKSNRAGTKLLSLLMASFHSYGNLHAPMVMLLSIYGMFSAIVSKAVRVEMIFSSVMDYLGLAPTWEAKTFTMFFICLMVTFFNFLSYCPNCYTVELSMETVVLPNVTLVIILGELVVVCGLYGIKRFFNNVSTMIAGRAINLQARAGIFGRVMNLAAVILWRAVIPAAILYSWIAYLAAARTNVEYYDVIAHTLLLLPIPLCAMYKVIYFYLHKMSFWRLFIPDAELWGPRSSLDRELAEKNEKLVRS